MFTCDGCGKRYKYKRGLYQHKKDECGQAPKYQCPQCPYRASQKGKNKIDDAGMFACDVCGKEYRYKRGLRRHKKFECGQDPKYQCPQCPYKTKHNSSLKTHIAKKHSDSESQAAAKTSSSNSSSSKYVIS
ncbi:hypothetical protein M8J76_002743 [Diaphorina citri]|nr:hypothetical protein M8J76_002743 [Diaphorina citri]